MGSSVETCIACGLASPATDEEGDVRVFSLTVPMVFPSAIPADATEIGCPIFVVRAATPALALETFSFRGFDDDPLPDVDDHASDDVGGGGKSCATTVACAWGTLWRTACSSEGGNRNSYC